MDGAAPRERPDIPRLVEAKYLRAYEIEVRFEDGRRGVIDLREELRGPVFEPLRDLAMFRQFRFDEGLDTIVWPTGADLAPEFLYERAISGGTQEGDSPPTGSG